MKTKIFIKTNDHIGRIHYYHKGDQALMCSNCYELTPIKMEAKSTLIYKPKLNICFNPLISYDCEECGYDNEVAIILDGKIASIISDLNKKGYKTCYSCEGHFNNYCTEYIDDNDEFIFNVAEAYISFEKPLEVDSIPKFWVLYNEDDEMKHRIITTNSDEKGFNKNKALDSLRVWVKNLPEV